MLNNGLIRTGWCSPHPSHPSTIGLPDLKPTSIHLITITLAMHLLLVLQQMYFLDFSKIGNLSHEQNPEIGSPDPKITSIHLITMKLILWLILVPSHKCFFWNFPKIRKIYPLLLWTWPPKFFTQICNQLSTFEYFNIRSYSPNMVWFNKIQK